MTLDTHNDHAGPSACGREPDRSRTLSRRTLLGGAAAAALGVAADVGPVGTRLAWAETGYTGDILVVLSLRGGFDGLSAVAPVNDPDYVGARPTVGLTASTAIQLDSTFGLHPALAPLLPLWQSRRLGFVHAVGQSDPTRSHFQAMERLEHADAGSGLRTGWIDRMLGLSGNGSTFQALAVGGTRLPMSLDGPAPSLAMPSIGSVALTGAASADARARWSRALSTLHTGVPTVVAQPAAETLAALGAAAAMRAAPDPAPPDPYPAGSLGGALHDVARVIRGGLPVRVACVDLGDWDMHAGMGLVDSGWMHDQLAELGGALAAFAADLGPLMSRVTLVTLSEFGRRVAENGSGGLDHGHGNLMLVMGGGVVGGRVHGRWPGLAPDALVDGDLAATTDYRSVVGEILRLRCGVTGVAGVFPGFAASPVGVVVPDLD